MSRFFTRLSPLFIIAFFWAMVVAPWCVVRCVHAGGLIHLHEMGRACCAHAGDCDDDHHDDAEVCAPVEAPDALPQARAVVPPVPYVGPAPEPVRLVEVSREREYAPVAGRPQGPPGAPTRRTHGRGALPLLS